MTIDDSTKPDDSNSSDESFVVSVPPPLRLTIPLIVVIGFWILYFGLAQFEIYNFFVFLGRLVATLLSGLILSIWWLNARRFNRSSRWLVLGLVVVAGVVSSLLLHRTVTPVIPVLWAIPATFTAGLIWLILSRQAQPSTSVLGLGAIAIASWVPGTLLRMEGLNGDGTSDRYWRWSASSEDRFLTQLPQSASELSTPTEPMTESDGDWTMMRGPHGNSRVSGLKLKTDWKSSPPKLLWKNSIGPGWSSVAVVGKRLFTQEQRGDQEMVTCYDADTGKQIWAQANSGRFEEPLGGVGPRATPTFASGRLYTMGARGRLDCLEPATGDVIWSVDVLADNEATLPMWGYSISPLVLDNRVIVFAGGKTHEALTAYDATSGERVWRQRVGIESYSSPSLVMLQGVPQVLYLSDKMLVSVNAQDGTVYWTYDCPEGSGRPTIQCQPLDEQRLLVSFVPTNTHLIEVTRQDDEWKIDHVWTSTSMKPDFSDFVAHEGYLYGFDGIVFACVDLETGERMWKKGRYGSGQALLIEESGSVLVTTEKGELVLVECSPEGLNELAKLQALDGKTWNHQAIADGRLYVRNAEEFACYELPVTASASNTEVAWGDGSGGN